MKRLPSGNKKVHGTVSSFGTSPWGGGAVAFQQAVGATGEMWVISAQASEVWFTVEGIPILFPAAAAGATGAYNCFTATCSSFFRGTVWPF